jgi:cytidylate kinase
MIDVLGKSADDVALEIVTALGTAPSAGCVLVLQVCAAARARALVAASGRCRPRSAACGCRLRAARGCRCVRLLPPTAAARTSERCASVRGPVCVCVQGLSGTGKGTTVAKLQRLLPHASAWSNGNIFRSLTLLTVTYFEKHGLQFSPETELPAALLSELMGYLHFVQVAEASAAAPAQFDVRIDGLGVRAMVSEVANTLLKEAKVSKNIPSVAKVSQGEVISFAAHCAEMMRAAGCNVLMEGRAQTLNYVRTPHRFELTLSKPLLSAQRAPAVPARPPGTRATRDAVHCALMRMCACSCLHSRDAPRRATDGGCSGADAQGAASHTRGGADGGGGAAGAAARARRLHRRGHLVISPRELLTSRRELLTSRGELVTSRRDLAS